MKRFFTALLAMMFVLSLVACVNEHTDTTTAPSVSETETTTCVVTTQPTPEDVTASEVETQSELATSSETATTTKATTTKKTETTTKTPMKKSEILELYNDATAKAAKKEISFNKKRETGDETYSAGLALKAFKGTMFKFMGIGEDNIYTKEVEKNDAFYSRYLKASGLILDDITDAACIIDGDGNSKVTIYVKEGASSIVNGGSLKINAPLDKCGISTGEDDKDYYDHKTAQIIFDAIDEITDKATVKESYKNAVIKATVDDDGRLKSLTVTFDISCDISQVYGSNSRVSGTTTIRFSDFSW